MKKGSRSRRHACNSGALSLFQAAFQVRLSSIYGSTEAFDRVLERATLLPSDRLRTQNRTSENRAVETFSRGALLEVMSFASSAKPPAEARSDRTYCFWYALPNTI